MREESTFRTNVGLAEMLRGGVIMDVVTPRRRVSREEGAPSPSWRSSACRPISAAMAGSLA